ncbi:MAG: hypothetical protein ABSF47_01525 [Minisyncoccia bacterium]
MLTTALYIAAAILVFAALFQIRLVRARKDFARYFTSLQTSTEEVFAKLLRLRKLAEDSDPRFSRPGKPASKPYPGWLDIAETNWHEYHCAKRAAAICSFL